MSVLNIFKKKKVEEKKIEEKKSKKIVAPVVEEKKVAIKENVVPEGNSSALLISPYLSEKSTILRDQEDKYIFKVNPKTTKNEVKKLIENIYNVEVTKVNVINTPAKAKRWRQKKTYFRRNKKMMVTIKKGQKIELGI
jgi:large subunit ribosomal protein L23